MDHVESVQHRIGHPVMQLAVAGPDIVDDQAHPGRVTIPFSMISSTSRGDLPELSMKIVIDYRETNAVPCRLANKPSTSCPVPLKGPEASIFKVAIAAANSPAPCTGIPLLR